MASYQYLHWGIVNAVQPSSDIDMDSMNLSLKHRHQHLDLLECIPCTIRVKNRKLLLELSLLLIAKAVKLTIQAYY
jgi:hypothetical protein